MSKSAAKNLDTLTGVPSYPAFLKALDERMAEADKGRGSVSLAMVDIDWFKKVNDEHGHEVGDEVLKTLAEHLKDTVSQDGEVYRYAKDEFLVLMPGVEKEQAFLALETARSAFDREHTLALGNKKVKLHLSLSVGVASYPEDGNKSQDVIRKVSDALHRAKATGRNRVALAREERMVTKTSHYTQGQLERLSQLGKREGVGDAVLLREALDDLLRKYTL